MTDDLGSRVSALERQQAAADTRLATTEVRVDGLTDTVKALASLPTQYATMSIVLTNLQEDVQGIAATLKERDQAVSRDRRAIVFALWGLAVAVLGPIVVALILYATGVAG